MNPLKRICGVLDMDGFQQGGSFHPREVGFTSVNERICQSLTVELSVRVFAEATERERTSFHWCTKHLHGLTFFPEDGEEADPPRVVEPFVRECYRSCKTGIRNVVGYKGGQCERDLLNRMGIPCHNIEDEGCPKFDTLWQEGASWARPIVRCPVHVGKPDRYHCPKTETLVFCRWIRRECLE